MSSQSRPLQIALEYIKINIILIKSFDLTYYTRTIRRRKTLKVKVLAECEAELEAEATRHEANLVGSN